MIKLQTEDDHWFADERIPTLMLGR